VRVEFDFFFPRLSFGSFFFSICVYRVLFASGGGLELNGILVTVVFKMAEGGVEGDDGGWMLARCWPGGATKKEGGGRKGCA